jgi:large-conductance mechanosensitive channel
MDVLDTLKKEWQKREPEFPKLTYDDIYAMILKKSSSIVKWIFIISIGEILLWTLISVLLLPDSSQDFNTEMGLGTATLISSIINYIIVAVFIFFFYKNYKSISTTETVKNLMESIIKTRKTVRYFVYYNIGVATLGLIAVNIYLFLNKEKLIDYLLAANDYGTITGEEVANAFFLAEFVIGTIFIGLLILFYYLIYGILLKRLKRNYSELKKIEV